MSEQPWWRSAVIYQIYPRSFQDTDDNGVGDLPGDAGATGLRRRARRGRDLDLAASLPRPWRTSATTSPTTATSIRCSAPGRLRPRRGEAHRLGLKVIIDQVLSHTSDRHAWFRESREAATTPGPTGTCGPTRAGRHAAEQLAVDLRRRGLAVGAAARQYYLHNFLASQPDLNFHNADVRAAQLDNVRFWLDRGVDGFRLDAINFCFHDRQLRDNPAKPPGCAAGAASAPTTLRFPVPLAQQRQPGEPRLPGGPARACSTTTRAPPRGRDLLGGLAGDDGGIHRAHAPAHGLQLRAARPRTVPRATSATRCRRWRRR